jgi:hypothetical protein
MQLQKHHDHPVKEHFQSFLVWTDERFDLMGHNAKFGVYSMFSTDLSKIVHFELLQV